MRSDRKNTLMLLIIIVILVMGIGYAFITTTLTIDGISDIDSASWNVYFDNVQVSSGSVTGDKVTTAPTISQDKIGISFHVRLSEPGDFYEFTVDVKNSGTIDAMIETITKTINGSTTVPDYLNFDITYEDGVAIKDNQLLAVGTKETYKIRLEYKTEINPNQLPTTAKSLLIRFRPNFIQATGDAEEARTYVYAFNEYNNRVFIGNPVTALNKTFDSVEEVLADTAGTDWTTNTFLRYRIENDIIVEAAVGVIYQNNIFYLVGGDNGANYEKNVNLLNTYIGEENCEVFTYGDDDDEYHCYVENVYSSVISNDGHVMFQDRVDTSCMIAGEGNSNGNGCSFCSYLD